MSVSQKNNGFLASENSGMRNAMQNRRLAPDTPILIPYLDKLEKGGVVCEVGCGPGGITLDIAQKYPHLTVLGMDVDEISIKNAKEAADKAGTKNIHYAAGDACNLSDLIGTPGFDGLKGGCDLVYAHAAVMHTGDQLAATKEMRTASKPGGTIVLMEGDMGLFFGYPSLPGITKLFEVFPRLAGSKNADPYTGRKLLSYALKAGYTRDEVVDIQFASQILSKPEERKMFAKGFDSIFKEFLDMPEYMKAAEISEGDIKLIREALPEWAECEDGIITFPSVQIVCVDKTR